MRIRAQGRHLVIWMGMAIDASSRLWMAGVVSVRRDRELAERLLRYLPDNEIRGISVLLFQIEWSKKSLTILFMLFCSFLQYPLRWLVMPSHIALSYFSVIWEIPQKML